MKTSFKHTRRWIFRVNMYDDLRRKRFVVYRRAGSVRRSTSVRYGSSSRRAAWKIASFIAVVLKHCPAKKLERFDFAKTRREFL